MPKKSISLKKSFYSWSERADINCYNKIFEYENIFVRLFWLFVFLASLSVTAWFLSSNKAAYLEYDVVSKAEVGLS